MAGNGIIGYSGDGGSPLLAKLNTPYGVAVSSTGYIYIGDAGNHRVRVVKTDMIDKVDKITTHVNAVYTYPNPCHEQCTITLKNAVTEKVEVVISNLGGEEVYRYTTRTNIAVSVQISWPSGTYIISATVGQQLFTSKLFIE